MESVLLAFDKFKDALTASSACDAAARGLQNTHPEVRLAHAPLTDGGEGFATILTDALGGQLKALEVTGPRFEQVEAAYGLVDLAALPAAAQAMLKLPEGITGTLAVLEMAQAAGLEQLPTDQRDPWQTTTRGVGELLLHVARAENVAAVLLGIGGSATNDCGVGALEAMGALAYGHDLQPRRDLIPAKWREIASLGGLVNAQELPPMRIACDVTNPLLGERGSTRVFGPQKGLKPEDTDRLERAMAKMGARLLGLFDHLPETFDAKMNEPGAGAAGGIGFGLKAALPQADFVPGLDLVSAWLDLPGKLAAADTVITGEGKFDASSLEGKGPLRLVELGGPEKRYLVFAGAVSLPTGAQLPAGLAADDVVAITPDGMPLSEALARAGELLEAAVAKRLGSS